MKLIRYVTDRDYRFLVNNSLGLHRRMPDEAYLIRTYEARLKKTPDLSHPRTFNEKLQWLKLHDRRPEYHRMADKAEVKELVAEKLGSQYITPTLGVYRSIDEIDFDALPEKFVLKCTHDSGGLVICDGRSKPDRSKIKKNLGYFLRRDYYSMWREWPYLGLPHRIIAEEFIESDGGLTDYKVHCFNGEPKVVLVCKDRFAQTGLTEDFFTEKWEHLDVRRPDHPNAAQPPQKPAQLCELLRLSRILSADIPFVRVDFYIVGQRILFSELTFFPAAGLTSFVPEEWDRKFGDLLELPS